MGGIGVVCRGFVIGFLLVIRILVVVFLGLFGSVDVFVDGFDKFIWYFVEIELVC